MGLPAEVGLEGGWDFLSARGLHLREINACDVHSLAMALGGIGNLLKPIIHYNQSHSSAPMAERMSFCTKIAIIAYKSLIFRVF